MYFMNKELLYQLALTRVPNIGDVHSKTLINIFGDASAVFKAPVCQLERVEGIGTIRAGCIRHFRDFKSCEAEISFMQSAGVQPIFISDKAYPQRLLHCYDSPLLLYYKGNADLNATKIVSIVGTRSNSEYGRTTCEQLIADLKEQNILVVSGLAFGIDTIAHRSALKNGLSTIGVLAHGLDRIYPNPNRTLAKEMLETGGLLTDFTSGSMPDKQNFPKRNRIVAGICDALIVIESQKRGGSLITAELAGSYNKEVFAVPGRAGDLRSEGCNYLIKSNKALMITGAADLLNEMNWLPKKPAARKQQRELFIEFTKSEKAIVSLLQQNGQVHIDDLYFKTGLSSSSVAEALLMLEMSGVVVSLPGKMFRIV